MPKALTSEFGPIRAFLWPIRSSEFRKVVPMALMCFLICFNYSILRCMKDVVVVTSSGAEVIPFIKVWALLPMAILLTYFFSKLSNRFTQERVVYIMVSGFLVFFAIFAFVLYPMRDWLHPNATADTLSATLPQGVSGLVAMFRNWTLTGFYVMAELWSSIVLGVLFWGFANEVTKISEARRFYAVLSIASNIAAIIAGQAANYFTLGEVYNPNIPFGTTGWEQTVILQLIGVIIIGMAVMAIFRWMNKDVLNDPTFDDLHSSLAEEKKKKKKKLSMRESFSFLSNSKYLLCIATIVIGYNLVINLVEVIWKDQLNLLYPIKSDYYQYMNNLTSAIGVVSTITAFFLPLIIGRFGWTLTALVTPFILLVTSAGFFTFYFYQDYLSALTMTLIGASPLSLVVFFGGAQNCLSKAAKYSVFDTTKEMSFIPLDHDVKLRGKAAIDGVGSRFGKSGGSIIHQILLMVFGNLSRSAPYVAAILTGAIALWISATRALGRQFNNLVAQQENGEEVDIPLTTEQKKKPVLSQ